MEMTETDSQFRNAALVAPLAQQTESCDGLFQDGKVDGFSASELKRSANHPYDDRVANIAEQARRNICRFDAQERRHAIGVNLCKQLHRRVLKPIV